MLPVFIVRLGIQYRFQQGKMQVNCSRFLGYDKDENGQLVINTEEAKIVKRIFLEYLEGSSLIEICKGLERDGVLTGAHKEKWRPETVQKMLKNEKYTGDAFLQKTYTAKADFKIQDRVRIKATREIAFIVWYDDRYPDVDSFLLEIKGKNEMPLFYERDAFVVLGD